MAYAARFEIDIVRALTEQLEQSCDALEVGALSPLVTQKIAKEQGVYQLFLRDRLVYVGKADDLRSRLEDHYTKISGRRNIGVTDMGFKCLYVHRNWTAMAPEDAMINHYRSGGFAEWNGTGFGPHDPGRNREETNKPPAGFDAKYPIREDWACTAITAGSWNGRELLMRMKETLPYLLRYETSDPKRWRDGHPDYNQAAIEVPASAMRADELLKVIAQHLPGWQATVFPSHLILYKESRKYLHGRVLWPLETSNG